MVLSAKTGEASASGHGNKLTMQPTTFAADIMARWGAQSGCFAQGAIGSSITRIGYNMAMGNVTVTPSALFGGCGRQAAASRQPFGQDRLLTDKTFGNQRKRLPWGRFCIPPARSLDERRRIH
jgi:hypothetical protein